MKTSTPSFRFKRFNIEQNHAAMKVGFDGVLLGAWANVQNCRRILDVGTGTGLVALMLAQRTKAQGRDAPQIHAVEIDATACRDAESNVAFSPWSDRVTVFQNSIQDFVGGLVCPYDLIVCNPPYFDPHSPSPNRSRAVARQTGELTLAELVEVACRALGPAGNFGVVLPMSRQEECRAMAANCDLFCRRTLTVKPNLAKPAKRILLEFQFGRCPVVDEVLTIEKQRHRYTTAFRTLTKEFYLEF